jgi:hypothetical protein
MWVRNRIRVSRVLFDTGADGHWFGESKSTGMKSVRERRFAVPRSREPRVRPDHARNDSGVGSGSTGQPRER